MQWLNIRRIAEERREIAREEKTEPREGEKEGMTMKVRA
jgi:hypothetical protein